MFLVENFSSMAKTNVCRRDKTSRTKMTRSYLRGNCYILVKIGVGRSHRRQVLVFDTYLNTCVRNKKPGLTKSGRHEPMVILWMWLLDQVLLYFGNFWTFYYNCLTSLNIFFYFLFFYLFFIIFLVIIFWSSQYSCWLFSWSFEP